MTAVDAAARAAKQGAAAIIYTNIGRDGTEDGPDVEGTRTLAGATSVPVIASGGVGSLEHLRAVAALAEAGVAGVIVGRALYSGAVRLAEAQAAAGDV
jgi:phosphoribosylformimino-5-aminoimidazole carboxamide ribotide isomerase